MGSALDDAGPVPDVTPAFEALVRTEYGKLCRFATRLVGSREVAEDVVHDVLLRLWQERERIEARDLRAYVYRSLRNRIISDQRQVALRRRLLAEADDDSVPRAHDVNAAQLLEGDDLAQAAARAVDGLPERCRLVFTMRREQDLSYAEIARVLDVSLKTVENQMSRAIKLLRSRLAHHLTIVAAILSSVVQP
jgi:RNA polymerase sigma-70 factor (ECF subfamily)